MKLLDKIKPTWGKGISYGLAFSAPIYGFYSEIDYVFQNLFSLPDAPSGLEFTFKVASSLIIGLTGIYGIDYFRKKEFDTKIENIGKDKLNLTYIEPPTKEQMLKSWGKIMREYNSQESEKNRRLLANPKKVKDAWKKAMEKRNITKYVY